VPQGGHAFFLRGFGGLRQPGLVPQPLLGRIEVQRVGVVIGHLEFHHAVLTVGQRGHPGVQFPHPAGDLVDVVFDQPVVGGKTLVAIARERCLHTRVLLGGGVLTRIARRSFGGVDHVSGQEECQEHQRRQKRGTTHGQDQDEPSTAVGLGRLVWGRWYRWHVWLRAGSLPLLLGTLQPGDRSGGGGGRGAGGGG